MTKSEINLMLHNFEATVPWRNAYKNQFYKDVMIVEAITNEIALGNNTIANMEKSINVFLKVNHGILKNIIDTYIGVLWYMVPGKKTKKHYYLIEQHDV
jgi:hypothetical protein